MGTGGGGSGQAAFYGETNPFTFTGKLVDALGIEPSGPKTTALQAAPAPYGSTHPRLEV